MFRNWKTNAVKSDYLPLSQLNNGSTDALDHLPKDRQPRWSQRSTVATYLVVSGLLLVLIRGIYGQLSSELSQRKAYVASSILLFRRMAPADIDCSQTWHWALRL